MEREKSKFFEESEIFLARLLLVSLHSFLSLSLSLSLSAYNDEYTRADDNKRKNTPAECEESLQQSAFCRAWWCEDTASCDRNARASSSEIFFFLSGLFERRGRRRRRRRGADETKDKNFGKREEKRIFFLKERERKDTGLYKKRRTLFFRAVLFE